MSRRTNQQFKDDIKNEYGAMREAGKDMKDITRRIWQMCWNKRLILEAVQEYNDERIQTA